MSEIAKDGINSEGFKTLEEIAELLRGMSREELAALTAMLTFRKELNKQKRNRQRGGC